MPGAMLSGEDSGEQIAPLTLMFFWADETMLKMSDSFMQRIDMIE